MLTYCRSADLAVLADHLLKELNVHPLDNPLAPEILVVQNYGMAQWLSLHMAEEEGIAANLKFEFPAERIWSLIRIMDKSVPQTLPTDRGPLTWSLMRLLNEHGREGVLDVLYQYEQDDDVDMKWVRRWKLCSRIADVFDQYLVYRPEFIWHWEEERLLSDDPSESWQATLWRALKTQWKRNAEKQNYDKEKVSDRATLQRSLLEALDKKSLQIDNLPERVTVFGVSEMPPVYIEILVKLSTLIDVYFYEFGVDDTETNDFMKSVGQEGADYRHNLEQIINEHPSVKEQIDFTNLDVGKTDSDYKDLLTLVKRDLNTSKNTSPSYNREDGDHSIQIHSCHSPMREVEVLYDQLLALFDDNAILSPADIHIMTPDIETYAPVIDAVFGTTAPSLPKIPYTIADRGATTGSLALVFLKILELLESRFKVTDVIDVIGMEPLQKMFGLTDEGLNKLEGWIKENRIKWGKDGAQKKSMGLPQNPSFTWRSGLDRMVLGYAMKPVDDQLFEGIYPYEEIEGTDNAALIGSFSQLMHMLFKFHKEIVQMHSLKKWSHILGELLTECFPGEKKYMHEWSAIRHQLDQLAEDEELIAFREKIPFRIIRNYLEDQLSESRASGGGHIGKGVTFSSLMPMRSIPFKVIGMIGLNDGVFPYSKTPVEFNLLQKFPKRGDRSRSKNDRYLFLQNILSAQEVIYISFIGQSNRQDLEFPPSVILREFFDYLENKFLIKYDNIITKHPLQAFSPRYFKGKESRLFSYSSEWREVANGISGGSSNPESFFENKLPEPEEEWRRVSLRELIHFYQHPAKYLLQNRLGIHLIQEEALTEDREPFQLTGLDGYLLGQELLGRHLEDKDLNLFKQLAKSLDLLPQGWPGEQAYQAKLREVNEFAYAIGKAVGQEKLEDEEVTIELGGFRISGRLNNIYTNARIQYRFGRMRPKDVIDLWISHLAFLISKPDKYPGKSFLITRDPKKSVVLYSLAEVKNPHTLLMALLERYWQGLQHPIMFFPNSSFAYAHEIRNRQNDKERGLKMAEYQWHDKYSNYAKEGDDPYNKKAFDSTKPLQTQSFINLAIEFWDPFLKALNQDVI